MSERRRCESRPRREASDRGTRRYKAAGEGRTPSAGTGGCPAIGMLTSKVGDMGNGQTQSGPDFGKEVENWRDLGFTDWADLLLASLSRHGEMSRGNIELKQDFRSVASWGIADPSWFMLHG